VVDLLLGLVDTLLVLQNNSLGQQLVESLGDDVQKLENQDVIAT
jgi:hypothetical protein